MFAFLGNLIVLIIVVAIVACILRGAWNYFFMRVPEGW